MNIYHNLLLTMSFHQLSPSNFQMIAEFLPDITSIYNLSLGCKKFANMIRLPTEQEQEASLLKPSASASAESKISNKAAVNPVALGTKLLRDLFLRNLERGLRDFGLPLNDFLQVRSIYA